jgi:hypothetical protein
MGRIKDIYIEIQNEYGYNLEDLPKDFSIEDYFAKRAQEISEEREEREERERWRKILSEEEFKAKFPYHID